MDHSMRSPPSSFRQQKLAPAQSPPRDASAAPYSAATAASAAIKAETVLPEEEETYESSPSACHSRATIKIVQQPLHARMCGFGEKDRRPIDPPPIVQLILDEPNYNELHLPPSLKYAGLKGEASASKRGRKRLVGSRTSTRTTKVHNPSGVPTRNSIEKDTESHGEDAGSDDDEEAHPHNSLQSIDEHEDVGDRDHGMNEEDRDKDKHKRIRKREEDRDEDMDSSHGQESSESRRGSTASGSAPTAMAGMVSEILPLHQDPLYVLHCSLWSEDGTEVRSMISTPGKSDPPKLTRILMGSVVISPILLNNAEGEPGWYFSFPDLSIRTEGVYTLKFKLMCITSFDPMSEQATKLITEETSTSFTVYSAKKFPGMTESTELSKAFARQGLKIPIRNDLRPRKTESKD
ncbi:hypothetical protein BGW38_009913 [Lunasporangiospora selenospora]|uniref:Velvet domain-containing protein n=1 Tax=Lunasporangiospora selenospora TaxID=979761 RepID=A0A9P6KIC6_9FUNG|nr:hypothetical protein BGW38_009913 [Lunasporangiospora selenospora]